MKIKNKYGYCSYDFETEYVHIYDLYIYKKYRRQGYGREMLKKTVNTIRNSGYDGDIQIVAIPQEDSISKEDLYKFYEKMGLSVFECYM